MTIIANVTNNSVVLREPGPAGVQLAVTNFSANVNISLQRTRLTLSAQ